MTQTPIIPVILSGGSGTRLWPLSRNSKPKQFLGFGTGRTMIQDTMMRCRGEGFDDRPIFVAAESHRFMVAEAALECGISGDILLEPMRRDSCAAVVAGALQAVNRDPQAVVLVMAADHHIPDLAAFTGAVAEALPAARSGWLVTFGILPISPATGYGYILPGSGTNAGAANAVRKFVEKPDLETAKRYLAQGYLWNSGNFLFKAASFLEEARRLVPGVVEAVSASLTAARHDLDFLRLDSEAFAKAQQISIDFAVMEKTTKAAVLAVDYAWNDIGSWDAVSDVTASDANGNTIIGRGFAKASRNVTIHSENRLTAVLGCEDLVVVSTRDAVMVVRRGATEKVKELVADLQAAGFAEASETMRRYRPWGHHELLDDGEGYEVRRVVIAPGQAISRQSHSQRAEHWIVVRGIVEARIGDLTFRLGENESATIPQGSLHDVRNVGESPALLVEVHTGTLLDDYDVKRDTN